MNWIEIVLAAVPSVVGVIGGGAGIIYWHENRQLKKQEVQQSSVDTQSQEIDLGTKYIEQSIKMQEKMQEMLKANNTDTAAIVQKVSGLETKVCDLENTVDKKITNVNRAMSGYNKRLGVIERYLNGNLKEFAAHEKDKK